MINITTSFFPLRMDTRSKDPIELTLKIKNMGNDSKFISYDVILEKSVSLDKSGLKKAVSFRHGDLKPNEVITETLNIFPFQGIKPGNHKILIRVNEHYLSYDSLEQKTDKIVILRSI